MDEKPRVLIIGDSISIGYTPRVAELLADEAKVTHNPGNGGDSANVLTNLDAWLDGLRAAVIHFNCGLHDLKLPRDTRTQQVPLERYRENLPAIVERLKATGAALIWAASTPVIDARHNAAKEFDRHNADVDAYNAAAEEVMQQHRVHINDLHAATIADGAEMMLSDDGVHMTEGGYSVLAQAVAECIRRFLPTGAANGIL